MDSDRISELTDALTVADRRRRETQRLSGVGFWELNHKDETLYWSEEIYAIYELNSDARQPDYGLFLNLICDEDRELVHKTYQDSVKLKTEYRLRYRVKAGGSVKWIEARGVTLYDAQGEADRSIGTAQDITEIVTAQRQIERLAYHDALTDLPNRKLFSDRLNAVTRKAGKDSTNVAVLFIDLDDFKLINDRYGHDVGDEVLVGVAHRLRSIAGNNSIFARIGGDEFAGVLVDCDDAGIDDAVRRVKSVIDSLYVTEVGAFEITASIGVTMYPKDNADPEVLLRHSDQAMYEAKENGKSQVCFFDTEKHQQRSLRRDLLKDIATAIRNDEFVLYFQPRIRLDNGAPAGAEALLRWCRDGHFHPPREVIAAIQDTKLVWELDNWVIGRAPAQSKVFRAHGIDGPFSVNINPGTIENPDFPKRLSFLLTEAGVSGETLELEILEVSSIRNFDISHAILSQCRALGVSVSLDDFGTGYSSLTHFHSLPIDTLKIDKRFIKNLDSDARSLALVKSILAIAHANTRNVVAEGIASYAVADALANLGCAHGQGFALARPMPESDFLSWSRRWLPAEFRKALNSDIEPGSTPSDLAP